MQCGFLGSILEQKKDISEKAGEFWLKAGVLLILMYQPMLVSWFAQMYYAHVRR